MQAVEIASSTPVRPLRRVADSWTMREHEIVITYWPDIGKIREYLPHRTIHAVRSFAQKCNLRKPGHAWTGAENTLLKKRVKEGVTRRKIAEELGLTLGQVVNRCQLAKIRGRQSLKVYGDPLLDSFRQRARALNMTITDLDKACGSKGAFAKWPSKGRAPMKHLEKALAVLDGKLTVEWSDLGE